MKTKNMTLGEASRFIKENGLYKTPEDKKDEKIAELEKQLEVLRAQ
jgi:broad-specificity NMP kinase